MGKGGKWGIGIAVGVVVLAAIGNLTNGDEPSDTAAAVAPSAVETTSSESPSLSPTSVATSSPVSTSQPASSADVPITSAALVADSALAAPTKISPVSKAAQANPVVALLATIPVKGRAPKTGYDRALFGPAWTDDVAVDGGHNGCDTRNDILRRDLVDIALKAGSNGCTVLTGILHDLYTGKTIDFTRGQGTSTAVQIDHVVALSDAWQKGAQQLSEQQRKNFANDPLNLQAVDGPTNEAKGDGDAATWLPPRKAYRCTYVSRQVQVKARYKLWVTQAEHDAILRVLVSCGAAAPTSSSAPAPTTTSRAVVTSKPTPPKTTAKPPTSSPAPIVVPPPPPPEPDVYYSNCSAARAAGAAPLYVGEPGYRPGLDRDHDGVACE